VSRRKLSGDALADVLARAADPTAYEAWASQARSARYCANPVRLAGRTDGHDPETGELTTLFASAGQPDGALLKACGQRRATACPACAAVYRLDARQLVAAGLRGGKGIPSEIVDHPSVFTTLTAPSFGPVHHQTDGRCHPGQRSSCPHGRSAVCDLRHKDSDVLLGQPLCPKCFDYERAVLWNSLVTELWRRTTIYLRRRLAGALGIGVRDLDRVARLSFVRVVEYQRRGLIHVHAVIRLDDANDLAPPPPDLDTRVLASALLGAVPAVAVTYPAPWASTDPKVARWGTQLDVQPISGQTGPRSPGAVAAYIAKYATKSADALGSLDHRLKADDLDHLGVSEHLRELVATAWRLGGRADLADLRLRDWAHTLGYRGHWLTKSRRYSTTFGALRSARTQWRAERNGRPLPPPETLHRDWRYRARGYTNDGDAWLAATAAAEAAEMRRIASEETRTANGDDR